MYTKVINMLKLACISLVFIACNPETKTEKTEKDSTGKTTSSSTPDFDESMDATKVSGYPSKVIADSLGIKMYEFAVNPGDTVPLHSHPDHSIYALEGGTVEVRGSDGQTQVLELKPGMGMISPAGTHSAKNTGSTAVKLLIVHVYRDRD